MKRTGLTKTQDQEAENAPWLTANKKTRWKKLGSANNPSELEDPVLKTRMTPWY